MHNQESRVDSSILAPVPVPAGTEGKKRVYILILNWNGWADTIECLESVVRSDYKDFRIIVLDNGSTDDSLIRIKDWADGRLSVWTGSGNRLSQLSSPPVPKPLAYEELDRTSAEVGGTPGGGGAPLVIIRTGENLGFAGGNNVGLRYVLARGDAAYAWILNNDTVVLPTTLRMMVDRLSSRAGAGMCGSLLLYYSAPETVQALGGFEYNRWLGTSHQLWQFAPRSSASQVNEQAVEDRMYGVQGASVLVSTEFLQKAGLLAEQYFLYYEEQDWAERAARAGFGKVFAPTAVVYHKEGASTGANSNAPEARSLAADYFAIRSRLLFTRKFYPYALPLVHFGLIGVAINRIRRRQLDRVAMVLRISLRALLRGYDDL